MDYQPGNPQNGPGNGYNPYNNNPYPNPYNNPYGAPMRPESFRTKGEGMANAAMILGIISLASLFFLQLTLPFMISGVGIVLALLSRGGAKKMIGKAKAGLICCTTALALDLALFIGVIWLILSFQNLSPAFQQEFNETFEKTYGTTYDEMIDEMMDEFEDIWDDMR